MAAHLRPVAAASHRRTREATISSSGDSAARLLMKVSSAWVVTVITSNSGVDDTYTMVQPRLTWGGACSAVAAYRRRSSTKPLSISARLVLWEDREIVVRVIPVHCRRPSPSKPRTLSFGDVLMKMGKGAWVRYFSTSRALEPFSSKHRGNSEVKLIFTPILVFLDYRVPLIMSITGFYRYKLAAKHTVRLIFNDENISDVCSLDISSSNHANYNLRFIVYINFHTFKIALKITRIDNNLNQPAICCRRHMDN